MSKVVCASDYGGPNDPSSGTHGYKGDNLTGKMAFAELNMGTALGNLPYKAKVKITYKGKSVVAEKLDIGLGGGPCNGHARRIDLWYETARALGFSGLDTVTIETQAEGKLSKQGAAGELVNETLHKLEAAIQANPNLTPAQKQKELEKVRHNQESVKENAGPVESIKEYGKDLAKVLEFIASSQGWIRIGKVLIGSILLIIAIDDLSKIGPGPSVDATGVAKKVVKI